MHTAQSHLVRESLMRDPAAGRHLYIRPRQLPRECLNCAEAIAHTDGPLPGSTGVNTRV